MKKNKFLKYLKHAFIGWLSITIIIFIVGIISYNLELDAYINQDNPEIQTKKKGKVNNGTEVFVVGTMHFETDNIKRDDFYTYISKVSPSIILYENSTQSVKRMVKRTDFINQMMSSFKKENKVESFVVHRYLKYHPECKVLSYDWEERGQFHFKHNYRKNMGKLLGMAHKLNREKVLSNEESKVMNEYQEITKKYLNLGNSKTPYDFNNPIADNIIRVRQEYAYHKIPQILKTKELSDELSEFLPVHMSYWDTRNMAMVDNIINQIKNNPNQRIVVLTGYSHRYYLIDELKKLEEEYDFTVKPI